MSRENRLTKMLSLFRALPILWRLGLVAATVTTILGALWGIRQSVYNTGYKACTAIYDKKLNEHREKSRENIINIERDYEGKIKKLEDVGTNDSVGPAVRDAIDGMPAPSSRHSQ